MAEPIDLYSIVVIGAMNPPIHHPAWYRLSEILTKDEADAASSRTTQFCLPMLAQFQTDRFTIVCQSERWEIRTNLAEALTRILQVAEATFKLLAQTPMSAFGFNFNHQRLTKIENVGKYLVDSICSLPFGRREPGLVSGQFTLQGKVGARTTQRLVSAVDGLPSVVAVNNNYHYAIRDLVPRAGHFDFDPLLQEHFGPDHKDAVSYTEELVSALNKGEGSE